jgi:hypothetical protein
MTAVKVPVALQVLDAMQQHLFAIALGLRALQARVPEQDLAVELERLEGEVDSLIRVLRSEASSRNPPD